MGIELIPHKLDQLLLVLPTVHGTKKLPEVCMKFIKSTMLINTKQIERIVPEQESQIIIIWMECHHI